VLRVRVAMGPENMEITAAEGEQSFPLLVPEHARKVPREVEDERLGRAGRIP
jgi:hypothetical protein